MNETLNILVLETGRRSDATYPYSLFMNERHIADSVSLGGPLLFLYEELLRRILQIENCIYLRWEAENRSWKKRTECRVIH